MKKSWFITILLCLLLLGGGAAAILTTGILPRDKCSKAYQHYAGKEGIRATYVADYAVGDSVLTGVTMLKATTEAAWDTLQHDFAIKPIPPEVSHLFGNRDITFRKAPKKDYTLPTDTANPLNNDMIVASWSERTVCIFHLETEQQHKAIMAYAVHQSANANKKTKNQTL